MKTSDALAEVIATWFGVGFSPVAPGTMGAIATVPLHLIARRLSPVGHCAVVLFVVGAGIWASDRVARRRGVHDPSFIVIDEVAGTLIAMGLLGKRSLSARLLALALFRVFDIAKPGPINGAQKLEPQGLGIMADDLLAGTIAGVTARWLSRR
jgi:phosphatidylglycerophosphatase A